jgi:hypothetical protein
MVFHELHGSGIFAGSEESKILVPFESGMYSTCKYTLYQKTHRTSYFNILKTVHYNSIHLIYHFRITITCFSGIAKDLYYVCGAIFALALVHVGEGPHFLSDTCYSIITKGYANVSPKLEDVHPKEIRRLISKVNNKGTSERCHWFPKLPIDRLVDWMEFDETNMELKA